MILGLCFGVGVWSLFFLGHIVAVRMAAPARRARIDRIIFMLGLIAVPAALKAAIPACDELEYWAHGGAILGSLWGILAYLALLVLYMPFFYTVATSLSVRTIVLIAQTPDGALPIQKLFDRFGSRALLDGRLDVMAQNGLLLHRGQQYYLTPMGRSAARAFSVLKRLWGLGAGG